MLIYQFLVKFSSLDCLTKIDWYSFNKKKNKTVGFFSMYVFILNLTVILMELLIPIILKVNGKFYFL